MSIRETTRKMTGTPIQWEPEVVLGFNPGGSPQATVYASRYGYNYGCYADPKLLERLAADLLVAAAHLRGER